MRTVLFASDEFAREPLERLAASRHEILAVVSRPDKPAGRGRKPASTAAVTAARAMGLDVWQPSDLGPDTFMPFIGGVDWEAGVVVAYGGRIPPWLLEMPPRGFVNLHPSLLPRYRGAAPVQRAIMNGASITGVTTILMDEELDSGDILRHHETPVEGDETAGELEAQLSHAGAKLLVETLDALEEGLLEPIGQEEDKVTYAPPLDPAEAQIDWRLPAEEIARRVRAMNPEPGAWTCFRGRRVKIWSAHVTDVPPEGEPGTIMNLGKEGFVVNTGTAALQLVTMQPEGRRRMSAAEFSRGQRLGIEDRFTRDGQ